MSNWKHKIARFMQDRYGPDQLYRGLLVLFAVLMVLNLFTRIPLFYYFSMVVFVYMMFRAFSKNRVKRAAENQKYLQLFGPLQKQMMQYYNRFRDRRTHRYRRCPNCRTTLRLKKNIGITHVKCPRCGTQADFLIKR